MTGKLSVQEYMMMYFYLAFSHWQKTNQVCWYCEILLEYTGLVVVKVLSEQLSEMKPSITISFLWGQLVA